MPFTETTPATDSANDLRQLIGDDATATFEDNPNFVDSNPTGNASSENVEEQRSAATSTPSARDTDDAEDDEDDVDEDEDLDDDDEEDDDEDDLDDETDEDDDEDDEDDDDVDDEDDEDDTDEVKASSVLRADGLLGYEDEADDAKDGVDRKRGDKERAEAEGELNDGERNYDPNSHEDGKWLPVERDTPESEGALIEDRGNTSDFIPPYKASTLGSYAAQ